MANNWTLSVFLLTGSLAVTNAASAQTGVPQPAAQPEVVQVPQAAPVQPAPPAAAPAPGFAAPVQSVPGGPVTAALVLPLNMEPGSGLLVQLPRPASTVIAADPRVVRVTPASPTSLFLVGVAVGRTNVIVTNEAGIPIIQYDVNVRRAGGEAVASPAAPSAAPPAPRGSNANQIEATLRQHVPGASGVKVSLIEGSMVLSGAVATPLQAQQVDQMARTLLGDRGTFINRLEVLSSMQVNVRVRVAEMKRTVLREMGLNWRVLGQSGNFVFAFLTPNGSLLPAVANGATNLIGAGYRAGAWNANTVIDALAQNDLVSILAEPNLTTMSGEPASFLSGGEYPYQVISGTGGAQSVGYEFKQYGVSLSVVPTVISPGKISLRVRPEVSELDYTVVTCATFGTCSPPGLTTRRAETTLELGSGQSFALAGLLSSKNETNLSGLPWLGEIPVLGALFKQTRLNRAETELVIIVTPYLVRPVDSPAQVRAPTDGFQPATDLGRLLYGRQVRAGSAAPAALDAGFILK